MFRFKPSLLNRFRFASVNSDFAARPTVTPAMVLRSCLIDLGLVSYPNQGDLTPCYVSGYPNSPDQIVVLYDTTGRIFGRSSRTKKMLVHPGVHIQIRTLDYLGFMFANEIATALDQSMQPIQTQVPDDGSIYKIQNVIRTSPVVSRGEEVGKRRQWYSIDCRIAFEFTEPSLG